MYNMQNNRVSHAAVANEKAQSHAAAGHPICMALDKVVTCLRWLSCTWHHGV